MGYALASAAAALGWEVDLVSGPVSLAAPQGVRCHRVVSAADMLAACEPLFPHCDVVIAVAAVADYRAAKYDEQKQKKVAGPITVALVPTVDVLKTLSLRKRVGQCLVGFAAETRDIEVYAQKKLIEKNLDYIVANDVGQPGIGMEADDNTVVVLGSTGQRVGFGPAPKKLVAEFVLKTISLSLHVATS
jgi:phosphopantothenoylcysteine decarboxylase/phosphopantothenate--cysteine ligase